MKTVTQLPSLEDAKLLSERMEKQNQLKARLAVTRDKIVSPETTGAEKLELQKLLVAIEVEMAAHIAETSPDPVDPLKVIEDANARNQKTIDDRAASEASQQDAINEMREKDLAGIAY